MASTEANILGGNKVHDEEEEAEEEVSVQFNRRGGATNTKKGFRCCVFLWRDMPSLSFDSAAYVYSVAVRRPIWWCLSHRKPLCVIFLCLLLGARVERIGDSQTTTAAAASVGDRLCICKLMCELNMHCYKRAHVPNSNSNLVTTSCRIAWAAWRVSFRQTCLSERDRWQRFITCSDGYYVRQVRGHRVKRSTMQS